MSMTLPGAATMPTSNRPTVVVPRVSAGRGRRRLDPPRPSFFTRIYTVVRGIPKGRVTTYGAVARALGVPRGARTVGWALSACPDNIPWHRVVNARGAISWRPTGGHDLQRRLLLKEGVRFTRGRIDLERFGWKAL